MNTTKTLARTPHSNSPPIHMETPSHPENNKLFHSLDVNHMYVHASMSIHICTPMY